MGKRGRAVIHQHLRQTLVERIRSDVKAAIQGVEPAGIRIPADLLAEYIVSTFILTLDWWIDSGSSLSPQQADDVFQSLVLPTLTTVMSGDDLRRARLRCRMSRLGERSCGFRRSEPGAARVLLLVFSMRGHC